MIEDRSDLPKGWRLLPINETANINPSTFLSENITDSSDVLHFSMASIDELNGVLKEPEYLSFKKCRSGKSRFIDNDILFAKITPCMQNKKSALVEGLKNNIGFGSSEFYVLRSKKIILPQYLFFFVRQNSFIEEATKNFTGTSGRQRVPSNFWQNIKIPVPPLPVQERIVAILQKADEIRRKRQEALAIADSILLSSYHDIFSDSTDNSNKFEVHKFGDLIVDIQNGLYKKREDYGRGIPFVRMYNINGFRFNLENSFLVDASDREILQYSLQPNDILFNRKNSRELVGKCTVIPENIPEKCVYESMNIRIRLDDSKADPWYIVLFLSSPAGRKEIEKYTIGSVNHASVNQQGLTSILIPVPSMKEQRYFRRILDRLNEIRNKHLYALDNSEKQFNSLLSRAFTGELTAEWEQINAEYIANRQEYYQCLPQLTLLSFLQQRQKTTLVTELMKYVFLLQMEGTSQQRYYQFIPYHYGPFAEDLYRDLETLQKQGAIAIDQREKEKTKISLSDAKTIPQTLSQLPADIQEDIATILNQYGDLNLNELLDTVYQKYPTYAKKSKRKRSLKKETQ